jgi:magnesium chelatase family protein
MIHSLAGTLPDGGLLKHRPFRDPHHSASLPALIGGGHRVKPGEISLAHRGVLFLDELPEFARATLESLRQPLETGEALVARVNHHVRFPARFQLIAAMNPCRCGHLGEEDLECTKAPRCGTDYQSKISGPLMDRIDLQTDVPAVKVSDLECERRRKFREAWRRGWRRRGEFSRSVLRKFAESGINMLNANADGKILEEIAVPDGGAKDLLNRAMENRKFSARAYYRVLRTARTVADLETAQSGVEPGNQPESHGGSLKLPPRPINIEFT